MEIIEQPFGVTRDNLGRQTGTFHIVKYREFGFPLWSQRDPKWAGDRLGSCQWTLGQKGCLVDAMAMGLTDALDEEIQPGFLNAELIRVGGYVNGCDLVFNRITKLYPIVKFIELKKFPKVPAPAKDIAGWVKRGDIVVALIDMDVKDADVDQHWVLIVGGDEEVLKIHDPWPLPANQQPLLLPPAYCRSSWNPARAIYAYVRYGVQR